MERCSTQINEAAKCNIHTQCIVQVISSFRWAGISLVEASESTSVSHPHCVVARHTLRCCSRVHDFHLRNLTKASADSDDEDDGEGSDFELATDRSLHKHRLNMFVAEAPTGRNRRSSRTCIHMQRSSEPHDRLVVSRIAFFRPGTSPVQVAEGHLE
jgi:hypothetical protein